MPFEKLTLQNTTSTISCLNAFWQFARNNGIFDYPDWNANTLRAITDGGQQVWVYRRNNRVDGVVAYQLIDRIAPDSQVSELWMEIGYLAVRPSALPTVGDRRRAIFIATKGAVNEGLRATGAVGLSFHFERTNTDLKTLVDTWPNVQYEDNEVLHRVWMRRADFLPKFDQWVLDSGASSEPAA